MCPRVPAYPIVIFDLRKAHFDENLILTPTRRIPEIINNKITRYIMFQEDYKTYVNASSRIRSWHRPIILQLKHFKYLKHCLNGSISEDVKWNLNESRLKFHLNDLLNTWEIPCLWIESMKCSSSLWWLKTLLQHVLKFIT